MFTKQDLDNFDLIFNLVKERGYTLEGAKKKLKENKDDAVHQAEMIRSLKKVKQFLIELKEEL